MMKRKSKKRKIRKPIPEKRIKAKPRRNPSPLQHYRNIRDGYKNLKNKVRSHYHAAKAYSDTQKRLEEYGRVKTNPSKPHITARFSVRCDGKGIAFFKSRADAFAYAKALHRVKPKATISVEK